MIKVGIVGASGYTGIELLRLLCGHPLVEVVALGSRSLSGKRVDSVFASIVGVSDLVFCMPDDILERDCDVVFFATPHGVAMNNVTKFIDKCVKVIDLGADFRIKDAKEWSRWYGMQHTQPEFLSAAVYGLAENNRAAIKNAKLVANPGCYPTAVQLALKPLLENKLIHLDSIIADCKSGVSGAGRGANQAMLLSEVSESFKAYGVDGHRHAAEIKQELELMAKTNVELTFVPHLVPMIRGIYATIYVDLLDKNIDVRKFFEQAYDNETFVNLLAAGAYPETRSVKASNFCQIAIHKVENSNKLIIMAVIDNLVKGAAGQAVQNMNIMFNFDEKTALGQVATLL